MVDVRKSLVRVLAVILTAGLVAASAGAQKKPQPKRARRETNASRQARIARTIENTYFHKYEVFGGGGFLRFRSGEFTQKNNEVSWAASGNYFLSPALSIAGDARGSFGNAKPLRGQNFNIQAPNPQINEYTFMGGLNYRFYRKEKVAISAEGLGGVSWGIFSGGAKGLSGTTVGLWDDGFRPAFSAGVHLDYNFYPNLAARVTPTYVATMFTSPSGGNIQNNFGVNAGIVYRFGRQK
jgi:hypothetical protein